MEICDAPTIELPPSGMVRESLIKWGRAYTRLWWARKFLFAQEEALARSIDLGSDLREVHRQYNRARLIYHIAQRNFQRTQFLYQI